MMKRGPKPKLESGRGKAALLKKFVSGETVSRYYKVMLVEAGYLSTTSVKETEGRGRPTVRYELTGRGRGLLALSQNW